jgi:hypothetical protein
VDALRARVDHDPGLLGELRRGGHVRHHQVAVHVHAQLAGGGDVLGGDVGLGAVGRDPGQVGAELGGLLEVAPRACFKSHSHSLIAAMYTVAR